MRISEIVTGLIVALVVFFVMDAIGMNGPIAILAAVIGFVLGLGVRRTFWPK